jgi:hypothetical protein
LRAPLASDEKYVQLEVSSDGRGKLGRQARTNEEYELEVTINLFYELNNPNERISKEMLEEVCRRPMHILN